jgi:hypothetical protein
LDAVQKQLTELLGQARHDTGPRADNAFATGLALLTVRDGLVSMQSVVERGIEWGVTPSDGEVASLKRLHGLAQQAMQAVSEGVTDRNTLDADTMRQREIWLNAEDSRARLRLERNKGAAPLRYTRHWSAVCAAYEELGNQLFHAHDALLGGFEED